MARVTGLEKREAPWHLRWFYGAMRKMFGRDLIPVKIQMRVPESEILYKNDVIAACRKLIERFAIRNTQRSV